MAPKVMEVLDRLISLSTIIIILRGTGDVGATRIMHYFGMPYTNKDITNHFDSIFDVIYIGLSGTGFTELMLAAKRNIKLN
jgi:hypothetical protein